MTDILTYEIGTSICGGDGGGGGFPSLEMWPAKSDTVLHGVPESSRWLTLVLVLVKRLSHTEKESS